jgi:hypothetical protein
VSSLTWEAAPDDNVSLAVATDGSNWYFYGHGTVRYRRIQKSTLNVKADKSITVTTAIGVRISIGPTGDVHFSKISKSEAIAMLKLYGVIHRTSSGELVVTEEA